MRGEPEKMPTHSHAQSDTHPHTVLKCKLLNLYIDVDELIEFHYALLSLFDILLEKCVRACVCDYVHIIWEKRKTIRPIHAHTHRHTCAHKRHINKINK